MGLTAMLSSGRSDGRFRCVEVRETPMAGVEQAARDWWHPPLRH